LRLRSEAAGNHLLLYRRVAIELHYVVFGAFGSARFPDLQNSTLFFARPGSEASISILIGPDFQCCRRGSVATPVKTEIGKRLFAPVAGSPMPWLALNERAHGTQI
jgi:hypothetical protein